MGPSPTASLRSVILDKEPIKGPKYAEGVIDVARALGFLDKAGTNLTLSDTGYAMHAIKRRPPSEEPVKALLLRSVLECDGDATINLLDIIDNPTPGASTGSSLIHRLVAVLDLRLAWADHEIGSTYVRDMILQDLSEAKRRLTTAADLTQKEDHSWSSFSEQRTLSAGQRVDRFYSHTVNPRRGWLKDLGCITETARQHYVLTESGHRILKTLREASCHVGSVFLLPVSSDLSEFLGVGFSDSHKNLFWKATAACFGTPSAAVHLSSSRLLEFFLDIYPDVKFHLFNEAAIDSLHAALAARLATDAQYIDCSTFSQLLDTMLLEFPDRVYRMRQRHGQSGYISVRA